jgi:serine/threonine protein kinase
VKPAAPGLPGAFAGTPEFASPEQFAGVPVDIRSDLYSLGVTLWEMVTGKTPFRGTPGEVMHQHQHAPLPLNLLEAVPQLVVILLQVLLEKDPAQRFQTPAELLRVMPTIKDAIDLGRPITHRSLRKMPSVDSRAGFHKELARLAPDKISLARLPITGSDIFGREEDIAFLDAAFANQQINVVMLTGLSTEEGCPGQISVTVSEHKSWWPVEALTLFMCLEQCVCAELKEMASVLEPKIADNSLKFIKVLQANTRGAFTRRVFTPAVHKTGRVHHRSLSLLSGNCGNGLPSSF